MNLEETKKKDDRKFKENVWAEYWCSVILPNHKRRGAFPSFHTRTRVVFFVLFFLVLFCFFRKTAWRAYLMLFSTTMSDSCLRHSKHKSWASFLVVLGKRLLLLENHPTLSSSRECCMALPCLIEALSDERKREPVLILTYKLDFVV